jgi:hypothetical protein
MKKTNYTKEELPELTISLRKASTKEQELYYEEN